MDGRVDGVTDDGTAGASGEAIGAGASPGVIKVDFPQRAGLRQVALTPGDTLRRSREAVDAAMATIHAMADRVRHTVAGMIHQPEQVEVEFGVTLDAEAGALIARTSVEAALTVRMSWSREPQPPQAPPAAPEPPAAAADPAQRRRS